MPFTTDDILYGYLLPVMVGVGVLLILQRFLPKDVAERYPASIAGFTGFLVGYGLLSLAPWTPTAHWHWLPYALLAAAIIGPISCAGGIRSVERPLLYLLVAIAAGWMLVPAWDDLDPSRMVHLVVFAAYTGALSALIQPLAQRSTGPLFPAILWAAATTAAVVLAFSGSLRFAQIALAGAGAIFGIMLVTCFDRRLCRVNGIALFYAILSVGALMVGRVNSFSEVPLASYVLVPAAPVTLWVTAAGPLSRLPKIKRGLVSIGLPAIMLGVAILLAVMAEMQNAGEY